MVTFTVSVAGLANGTYQWRVKDHDPINLPHFLANSGQLTLTGSQTTQIEMGLMQAGDANNDDVISVLDFSILKSTFGKSLGNPGYDNRADFTGDTTSTSRYPPFPSRCAFTNSGSSL